MPLCWEVGGVDKKFTPEQVANSLRVCADSHLNSCDGCIGEGQGCIGCDTVSRAAADMLVDLVAEVERLREERRWIPTSERLPDQELEAEPKDADGKPLLGGYECIAQIEGAKRPTALWYCHIDGEGVWTDESGENFYPVTHWKPMPKGPEV